MRSEDWRDAFIGMGIVIFIVGGSGLFAIPRLNNKHTNNIVAEASVEEKDPQLRSLDQALEGMVYRKDAHTGLCFGGYDVISSTGLLVVVPCDKVEAFLGK